MISGLVLAPKESTNAALPFRLPRVRRRQPRPQLIVHGRLEVGSARPLVTLSSDSQHVAPCDAWFMKRTQVSVFFLFVVLAVAAMTFTATASAGWTWDEDTAIATDGP
jgi:hypothetical protein